MQTTFRFSVRKLSLLFTAFALLMGTLAALTVPPVLMLTALLVLALFFLFDPNTSAGNGELARWRFCKHVIHYALAMAAAAMVCFGLVQLDSELVAKLPSEPAFPLLYVLSGQLFVEVGAYFNRVTSFCAAYMCVFVFASAIGLSLSVLMLRKWRLAKWYALLSMPGALVLLWAIVDVARQRR